MYNYKYLYTSIVYIHYTSVNTSGNYLNIAVTEGGINPSWLSECSSLPQFQWTPSYLHTSMAVPVKPKDQSIPQLSNSYDADGGVSIRIWFLPLGPQIGNSF